MTRPETPVGLFDDLSGVQKQPPWFIPHVDFLPTSHFCVGAEPRPICHESIHVCFLQPHLHCSLRLLHAHTDTVDFAVRGDAHHRASSFFEFTHLAIIVTLANLLLEVSRFHTFDFFFGEAIEFLHVHNLLSNGLQG